jgi:hypothetical protein
MPRRRSYDRDGLDDLLRAQDQLVTYAQLEAMGFLTSTAVERCRRQIWRRLLPGVICAQSGAPRTAQRMRAALLYAGSGSMLTGSAALQSYGFRSQGGESRIHVLVPDDKKRSSHSFVLVERTIRLPEPVEVGGLPVAPVPRAVFDTCRRTGELNEVRAVLAEAIQRGRTSLAEVEEELREGQIRGSALLRAALGEVRAGVRSVPEAKARRLARTSRTLPPMQWNPTITTANGEFLLRPDGWIDEVALAWEIDSYEWHLSPELYAATLERHSRATAAGIILIHHTPRQVERHPERCLRELEQAYLSARGRRRPDVRALWVAA